ncbi:SEC-C domain-containing protein [Pelagicoccus sp. NFK12]|uniref:UPF0225 protein IEN85_09605 n=1 Tax=Pelagicoccus enzymogenes TaxID=2773457 RepID=A0A927IH20_9BACT|nr:YchJ family metal-binding protein [Pelagicoccus enzymogenes]MBD5779746.1 SEC-C domain-containing protein [Pelagicoccus enzymogenes]
MSENRYEFRERRENSPCPCGSGHPYGSCCRPFHHGQAKPETAEQLMRSRYSAYYYRRVAYLVETTHPDTRDPQLQNELQDGINDVNWSSLTILNTSRGGKEDKTGKVEFIAEYFANGRPYELHELSRFKRHKGAWKYLDGKSDK